MGLKPAYRITANSNDVTETIKDRFVSLRLTDESGLQSDTLEITLADHLSDEPINLPPTGAELELWLGYDNALRKMGLFIVDEIELSGPPDNITIKAKSSVQAVSKSGAGSQRPMLTQQKTRSWEKGITIGDMAKTIAKEHGLKAAVAADLSAIALPHIDQVSESDIALLTRLVKTYDAVAKPAGGSLVIAKRGSSKSASGKALPAIALNKKQVTTWRVMLSKRLSAGTVIAVYRDLASAQDVEVKAGDGEPVKRLRHTYSTSEEADSAAKSEFMKSGRAGSKLSVTLPGEQSIIAESPLVLSGFRKSVQTNWVITKVEHSLDTNGYVSSIEAESKA